MQTEEKISSTRNPEDQRAFEELCAILFDSERRSRKELQRDIEILRHKLNDQDRLKENVQPIINERLELLREQFPEMFGPAITETIKFQIENSKDELVNALYPIIGKLISKYIKAEITKLKDSINDNMTKKLSPENFWRMMKAKINRVEYADVVLAQLAESNLDQILIIQKDSGKLIGEFPEGSQDDDLDVVASMLSVIKNFMEDAFHRNEEVEVIQYENNQLLIHTENTYFIVAVVKGEMESDTRRRLTKRLSDFSELNYHKLSTSDAQKFYPEICLNLADLIDEMKKTK